MPGKIIQALKIRRVPAHVGKTSKWEAPSEMGFIKNTSENERMSPKKGPFQMERIVFQLSFSGDMLVFEGVNVVNISFY